MFHIADFIEFEPDCVFFYGTNAKSETTTKKKNRLPLSQHYWVKGD